MDRKVFPQANDFLKIVKVFQCTDEQLKDNTYLMKLLGVSNRQVNYYLSANEYLGVIDNREFTDIGKMIKKYEYSNQIKELIRLVLSDEIFFDIFYIDVILEKDISTKDIEQIMYTKELVDSEVVAKRRASTVKSWVRYIKNIKNQYY